MKVLILAGGYGSRLSEETDIKPKPMVEIGGMPILWHIMKIYSFYGYNEFIILCGYKGYLIKEYFANYFLHNSNVEIDLAENKIEILDNFSEKWKITLLDTGLESMTGSRIKLAEQYINNERFFLTYGDGLCDVNINSVLDFHIKSNATVTMTASQPEGRFGALDIFEEGMVSKFLEKPKGDGQWINAGYFICEPELFDYIDKEKNIIFEKEPLQNLAVDGKLFAFKHFGFWQPMDTLKDKRYLENLWQTNKAKWKRW